MRPGAIYMKTKIKPVNWLAPITPSFNAKLLSCKTLQMNFVLKRQNYLKINILLINIATWCIVFHTMWRAIYEQHRSFGHSIPLPARRCSNCCISLQRETKNFTCERCGSKKPVEHPNQSSYVAHCGLLQHPRSLMLQPSLGVLSSNSKNIRYVHIFNNFNQIDAFRCFL